MLEGPVWAGSTEQPACRALWRPSSHRANLHRPHRPAAGVLRAMHALGGEGTGWDDEVALAGIVVILGAFLLWSWWKQRRGQRKP